MLRERLLSCHARKTTYILFGTEKYKKEVRQEFLRSPLMFGDFRMIEKEQYMYLGDMIATRGKAGSVEATIMKRLGRIKGAITVFRCLSPFKIGIHISLEQSV